MALPSITLPYQWRVTRYDPALRNEQGSFPLGDWSCFPDVGKVFGGKVLTYEEYYAWETVYANAAVAFLADVGTDSLRIVYLENKKRATMTTNDGKILRSRQAHCV